jgi:tetratricopeptide (TPR) repeat protein
MGLFGRKPYSRRDSLTAATEAQKKGKQKKAIAEYKKILENDGPDPMIHHKLALALAESNKAKEARESFQIAARAYDDRGFVEKALAVYATATHYLPADIEMWEALSGAHLSQERSADAVKTLLDARKHFKRKRQREELIRLLERACQIEPWHFEATFDLSRLLRWRGETERARELMEGLAARNAGRPLARARGALFRWSPTPAAAWRWLRALLIGR